MDKSPWFSARLCGVDTPVSACSVCFKGRLGESIVFWDTWGLQDTLTLSLSPEVIKVRNFAHLNMTDGRAWNIAGHFQPCCAMVSMLSKETVSITLPGLET